ncbi:hypothetical protein RSAG8_11735, partial [Rhizoctonia solani AG-8 WAC10335]
SEIPSGPGSKRLRGVGRNFRVNWVKRSFKEPTQDPTETKNRCNSFSIEDGSLGSSCVSVYSMNACIGFVPGKRKRSKVCWDRLLST